MNGITFVAKEREKNSAPILNAGAVCNPRDIANIDALRTIKGRMNRANHISLQVIGTLSK